MNKLVLCVVMAAILMATNIDCLRQVNPKQSASYSDSPAWKTFYIDQYLDHFNHNDDRTFKERYLVNGNQSYYKYRKNQSFYIWQKTKKDDWFNRESGPVFFYAGNEGDIEGFWNNTGFMFDIAPVFQALIVFAEHVSIVSEQCYNYLR